uniref:RagB/SusD family nutrient uptake outer membrane protein n=1 Tax=Prevotellamassilia timonensis TaxID=1852370 RepID=UPI004038602D
MACACGLTISSCTGDLDVTPINPQQTQVANDDALFNKLYATFSLTGQQGNAGKPDIPSNVMENEGFTQYYRMQWYLNEFTSDEAAWTWSGNDNLQGLMYNKYTANEGFALGLYYRLYFDITLCNSYINDIGKDPQRLAEARFIRAYNYASVLDIFGAGPFCTKVSSDNAVYYNRQQLFDYVESELLDIEDKMADPGRNTYGRADKVAVWLLLSRLYLNAEVYTGHERNGDAMIYANKVLNNGYYHLNFDGATNPITGEKYSAYQMLFLADNNSNGAQYEAILPVLQDGITTRTDGGTQLLIQASYDNKNDNMETDVPSGTNRSWGKCLQIKGKLVDQFFKGAKAPETGSIATMTAAANDDRALFYSKGYKQYITEVDQLDNGFASVKFRNVRSDGARTSAIDYVDTDLPLMRMAEAYLTYAEASVRKFGPNSDADSKLRVLRDRAHAAPLNNATLDDICAEWAREFWFEGRRRMDLIRFNKFAGQSDYKWEFMGGEAKGTSFPSFRKVFAIPQADLSNNPNLKQNEGYN